MKSRVPARSALNGSRRSPLRLLPAAFAFLVGFAASAGAAGMPATGGRPQTPADSTVSEYRIGAEDVLQIQVLGRPDLSGSFAVDLSGTVRLPLVGEVGAQGKTAAELGRMLGDRYQLLDPDLSEVLVTVAQMNSRSVTVVGEVRNPGRQGFRKIPDLWQVLLAAGGETDAADMSRVQIVPYEPGSGEARVLTVDLSRGIDKTPASTVPTLRPKDTVVVPSMVGNTPGGDKCQVLGAVRAPGSYRLGGAATVIEAISMAGGPLPDADLRKVRLTRPGPSGAVAYKLDLHGYLYDARYASDLDLRPGDTVTIPASRAGIRAVMDGIGRFAPVLSVATAAIGLYVTTHR